MFAQISALAASLARCGSSGAYKATAISASEYQSSGHASNTNKRVNTPFFGSKSETPFFAPRIQTKLSIGRPGDKYEQEADTVADRVVQRLANPGPPLAVQTKCQDCEEKEKLQRKEEEAEREAPEVKRKEAEEEEETPPVQAKEKEGEEKPGLMRQAGPEEEEPLQAKAPPDAAAAPSPSLESRLSSAKGAGAPMDKSTRQPMEAAFGQDFSRVRIHTDSSSAQMNRELNARAFTHGRDIYFNAGEYSPGSTEGRRLLAHELVHVGQQVGIDLSRKNRVLVYKVERPMQSIRGKTEKDRHISPNYQKIATSYLGPSLTRKELIQRFTYGEDGPFTHSQKSIIDAAYRIAMAQVKTASFQSRFLAFRKGFEGDPNFPTYQKYVSTLPKMNINNMDKSRDPLIIKEIKSEVGLPLEAQTGGVTNMQNRKTFLREFAVSQGIDNVVNLFIHENFHVAGMGMGPFELFVKNFEAQVGFPMIFLGGGKILSITQKPVGDYHEDVTFTYKLWKVFPNLPLPASIEIQIVHADDGSLVYDSQPKGNLTPAQKNIPSKIGTGAWTWNAKYQGYIEDFSARIVDKSTNLLIASKHFRANAKCLLGVSSRHCQ